MRFTILHISDLHIKNSDDEVLGRSDKICEVLASYIHDTEKLYIVVSGDIGFSGKSEQYECFERLISNIRRKVSEFSDIDINLITVPGNHDCDFEKSDQVRKMLLDGLKVNRDKVDESVISECVKVQDDYFDFRDIEASDGLIESDKLWSQYLFDVGGKSIVFDSINLSWTSKLNEAQGELSFPLERFSKQIGVSSDLRIVVLHHPITWIKQGEFQELRTQLRTIGDLILSGHEHTSVASAIDDAVSGESVFIEGAALQPHAGVEQSSFNIVDINLHDSSFKYQTCNWTGDEYEFEENANSWSSYKKLPEKRQNEFAINRNFLSWVRDPGANYTHPGKINIELSDIYIYPDLEEVSEHDVDEDYICSKVLLNLSEIDAGVLIKGQESSGKTALLQVLFSSYHDQGYVPVYLDSSSINDTSDVGLVKIIDNTLKKQYCDKAVIKWKALEKARKVLLLDDIDDSGVSDRYRWKIISFAKKYFGKVIVTASDSMDLNEVLTEGMTDQLVGFRHYEIQPFGFRLRYELIRRWRSIGEDYSLSSEELLNRIDKAEKVVNVVIGKNLVPRVPIYLLTLLQSLESENPAEIQNSAFGHYYEYLINESLRKVKVPYGGEFGEFLHYCSQLAWYYYNRDVREVSHNEVCEFTRVYSKDYTPVECERRMDILCDAKLFSKRGGYYSFAYPYVYYFFLGKYISENMDLDQEVFAVIDKCSKHAYVKDYANILLFVTHHRKSPALIESLMDNLKMLFKDSVAMSFNGDTSLLSDFIEDTSKLVYYDGDPHDYRRTESEIKDEFEKLEVEDEAPELCESELDLPSKINKLFKTIEIIGQMLKSYYGSLKNDKKSEMVREVFEAPLRAISEFMEALEKHKDSMLLDVEEYIENKDGNIGPDKRKALAKKFIYDFVGMVTFAFINKAAAATSSEHISGLVKNVADDDGRTSFKLAALASRLDMPGALPFEQINELASLTEKDVFAHRLLETIVLKHMYYFKVSEADKQRLCSSLGITMKHQRNIELKAKTH